MWSIAVTGMAWREIEGIKSAQAEFPMIVQREIANAADRELSRFGCAAGNQLRILHPFGARKDRPKIGGLQFRFRHEAVQLMAVTEALQAPGQSGRQRALL